MVSFERVFEVLDAPEAIADRPGAVDLVDPKGPIEFDDVTFRYPTAAEVTVASLEAPNASLGHDPDRDVLRGLSLDAATRVRRLRSSAPRAPGKTTLASLIPRLYDVTGGAVRVDGHDVRDLTQDTLRAAIGVVTPGSAPVPRDRSATTCATPSPMRPTPSSMRRAGRADLRHRRRPARRLRHDGRRARLPPQRRREAAPGDRPPAAEGPGGDDPRRGHEPPRQRERGPWCRRRSTRRCAAARRW